MSFEFIECCYDEAVFCSKHYDKTAYWRDRYIDPVWYRCYQMGNEL